MSRQVFLAGQVSVRFSFFGFLRRLGLCPLASLSFGHVFCAFHILKRTGRAALQEGNTGPPI
jgi:hypothetical protein